MIKPTISIKHLLVFIIYAHTYNKPFMFVKIKKKYRNLWPFLKGELNGCMIFEEKKSKNKYQVYETNS